MSIARYHVTNPDIGRSIAYARGVTPDGTRFRLAEDTAMTPGVALSNDYLFHYVFLGDFSEHPPTEAALEGARLDMAELQHLFGAKPVRGHREVALEGHGTECPGDVLFALLPSLG